MMIDYENLCILKENCYARYIEIERGKAKEDELLENTNSFE